MAATVQVGSILIENRPLILRALDLESECYSEMWGVLQSLTNSTLDQKIRAAGWDCVFLAVEVKATAYGALSMGSIRRALQQIFVLACTQNFNCLEVTKIVEKRFLGVPYITLSAHSRHIQQGSILGLIDEHRISPTLLQQVQIEETMKNLYVGNLPHSTTEPQLRTLFEVHGAVERVNIITDKETGQSKGFAFIEMTEAAEADKACLALSGSSLEGRALRVNEAKSKSH